MDQSVISRAVSVAGGRFAPGHLVWAITLFPRGFDQLIPQVLALFLF